MNPELTQMIELAEKDMEHYSVYLKICRDMVDVKKHPNQTSRDGKIQCIR